MPHAVQLVAALLLVLLNGFFVAAEFSLARARTTRLDQMAAAGRGGAALAREQVLHIDRYLAACQLGITLASLGLGWLGEPAFAHLIEPLLDALGLGATPAAATSIILAFVIITVLHVVVGELAPKSMAILHPEGTAVRLAWPLEVFRRAFGAFIQALNAAGNALVRALGVEPASEKELASSPDDLRLLIAQSEEEGAIEAAEAQMLEGVFGLGGSLTREIMTPRPGVTTLDAGTPVREALTVALRTMHSRFPVSGPHGVVGLVQISDLARGVLEPDDGALVRDVMGPALYVPETRPADDLLRDLRLRHSSLAVVLDEYGDFSGVVGVEDVIEEIVGEISDERDVVPAVERRGGGALVVPGPISLEDLRDHGVDLTHVDVNSVGGVVFTTLGRVPRVGESITVDEWSLTVESVRGTRIMTVLIAPLAARP